MGRKEDDIFRKLNKQKPLVKRRDISPLSSGDFRNPHGAELPRQAEAPRRNAPERGADRASRTTQHQPAAPRQGFDDFWGRRGRIRSSAIVQKTGGQDRHIPEHHADNQNRRPETGTVRTRRTAYRLKQGALPVVRPCHQAAVFMNRHAGKRRITNGLRCARPLHETQRETTRCTSRTLRSNHSPPYVSGQDLGNWKSLSIWKNARCLSVKDRTDRCCRNGSSSLFVRRFRPTPPNRCCRSGMSSSIISTIVTMCC